MPPYLIILQWDDGKLISKKEQKSFFSLIFVSFWIYFAMKLKRNYKMKNILGLSEINSLSRESVIMLAGFVLQVRLLLFVSIFGVFWIINEVRSRGM